MAVSISISITQNSQNIANNTSNVTVKVTANWTGGSHNALTDANGNPQAKGWVKIDGTTYNFASTFNAGKTTSGSQTICTKTVNVAHNANGTKTLSCSASYATGVSSGTVTASASKALTQIARLSVPTLSASSVNFGSNITLYTNRQSSDLTHKIFYKIGSGDWVAITSSASVTDSYTWTVPLSLMNNIPNESSLSITLSCDTYYGSTYLGYKTAAFTANVPTGSAYNPSVSISVSDVNGHLETYGAYVKGYSALRINVTASGKYGSAIKTYSTTADGKTYTAASVTTTVLSGSGTLTISTTVKDSRGRTNTASTTISVLNYSVPKINALSGNRCNADGSANPSGNYIAVQYETSITVLNGRNYATLYSIDYGDGPIELDDASGTYIFPADPSSSYTITLTAKDTIESNSRVIVVRSVSKFFSIFGRGLGLAIGKIAEYAGVFEIAFRTKFTGGIQNEVLEKYNDLDDAVIPNTYVSVNKGASEYANCPITSGTFVLEVLSAGAEGQVFQRLTTTFKETHETYERHYYQSSWGPWVCVRGDTGWIDLTLQSGISVGTECGYLKGRLKNGVLYIKGDVVGISANWKYFAHVPSTLLPAGLASSTRFAGVYNMSYFCGFNLTSGGQLYVSTNAAGTWDATKNVSINLALCGG